MGERYSRLFSLPENLYSVGAPVVIAAGALLKDNQTGRVLAQLKIRNISDKAVKAATVSIIPLDTVGKPLGEAISYQYLDLNAARDADFGQKTPVFFPDAATRAFSVSVSEVIFADTTVWTASETAWEPLSAPVPLEHAFDDKELVTQYRIKYGENCKCIFKREKDLWRCVCGALNHENERLCHRCQKEAALLAAVDLDALKESKNNRLDIGMRKSKKLGNVLIILGIPSTIYGLIFLLSESFTPVTIITPLEEKVMFMALSLIFLLPGIFGIISGVRHRRGLNFPIIIPIVLNVIMILLIGISIILG